MKLIDTGMVLLDLDEDGVGHLRLNRPEAANGMNVPFLRALYDGIMVATGQPGLRVLVLSGEGPNFCAGGDVKTFASKGEALPDYLREATAWLQNVAAGLLALPVPVVTAVHGFAAGGGGLGLVCASDIVVAAESAKFMSGAARVGMAPDAGSSATLPQLVGVRKAMEILLLNPTLSASEALEIGLITKVVPDEDLHAEALAVARSIAAGAPRAHGAIKRLVWSGLGNRVEAQLPEEARTVSELSGTADAREGLAAVLERRRPVFTGN
ncbi:enoyl-CoA hydratase/isomerase family protein [Pseudonocardia halophobica]|uniref:Enoyl-CoA hydratase n=1 Tax=Pseudonocardia halophobica TaxID=29401 RepID=A0A9W6KY47_9PSEU|nr:enoyl-CoA hydratase-related protein [Pseudonocardia halophobica]GLL09818.1 enoyl-CoA hydratase [Pseudonocardia halophobica]